MIELRRILVPTDFSKHSQAGLTYAAAFADKFGAEIYLLHVVQNLALVVPDVITMEPTALPTPSSTAARSPLFAAGKSTL